MANGLKYRTGQAVYRKEMSTSDQIKDQRLNFAKLIANLIAKGKPLIYTDETTFHTWMLKAKSWSKKKGSVLHARNNLRMGVTVYGAIGDCLERPVFELGSSTNA